MTTKTAIVTGASKGIGEAAAVKFCRSGYNTYFLSRSGSAEIVKRLSLEGFAAHSVKCDLSNEAAVKKVFAAIAKSNPSIDVLVNCAGIVKPGKIEDISEKDWHFIMDNNLTNTFFACKHAVLYMKKNNYGKIVNISSIAGRSKSKFAGVHYVSAKAALLGFTRQLAQEVGPSGINVNCIAPGQTNTEMLQSVLTPEKEKALKDAIPLGFIASPEHIADVIFFLASDEASYINGAIIDVNGGQL